MKAAERRRVLAAIGQSLEIDIHSELMAFFAQAVALNEKVPDQVNNELRNALTHFSRAYAAATYADAEADLRRASAHIDRAKRDCLKLSIIALHDRIQHLCGQVKAVSGTIDPALLARRHTLTDDRKRVLRNEINGALGVTNQLLTFLEDAEALEADLSNEYNIGYRRLPRWRMIFIQIKRNALAFVGGVVTAILIALLVPHPENLRSDLLRWLLPPTVSSTSTEENPVRKETLLQPDQAVRP